MVLEKKSKTCIKNLHDLLGNGKLNSRTCGKYIKHIHQNKTNKKYKNSHS